MLFYGKSTIKELDLPFTITTLGAGCISGCTSLKTITLPKNVSTLETNTQYMTIKTFDNSSLESIYVDAENEEFSSYEGVLYNKSQTEIIFCPLKITTVTMPDSLTSIRDNAFSGCSVLTSITIPESVTSIGHQAFINCTALANIIIPDGVTSIGSSAFSGCDALTSITIPKSVTGALNFTFSGCNGLTSINVAAENTLYSSQDGLLYNKDKTTLIVCPAGKTGSVEIPASVTAHNSHAFDGCSGLTSITVAEGNANYSSQGGVLYDKDKTVLHRCPLGKTGSVEIPDSVTGLGVGSFEGCSNLTSISVKDAAQNQLLMWGIAGADESIIIQRDSQTST